MEWYELNDPGEPESPCLLVFPDRIEYNAGLMLSMAKRAERLRPHIKTHKMAEIIEIQLRLGISKFKCATISEAELLAKTGATDILLAMQPVARQLDDFSELIEKYPGISFSTLVDSKESHQIIGSAARKKELMIKLWLDINNGMNRTGIIPDERAAKLFLKLKEDPAINLLGLHVYDGHIHDNSLEKRSIACNKEYGKVEELIKILVSHGFEKPLVVAGGTPTFPIHEKRKKVELSPGTPFLWDHGYGSSFPDLKFLAAAVLMTRIVSKPAKGLLCFDLGHKSVASEMILPRVHFLGNNDFNQISQSEEHLIVESKHWDDHNIGDTHYALPVHICPTVSKYPYAYTVKDHEIQNKWLVSARDH